MIVMSMTYVVAKIPPHCHQMSFEELFFGDDRDFNYTGDITNTRTYEVSKLSNRFLNRLNLNDLINRLSDFNKSTEELRSKPRSELYHTFYIPKKKRGLRRIDAPLPLLMEALRNLKELFETHFNALYHTSAFAYVKHRCTIDAVKRHQQNQSRWFGKYDLSNFFGSTTPLFVEKMLSMVFPFSEVYKNDAGKEELRKALSLAFLNGGLPQGTPLSPLITNLIMIPIDYKLSNSLRDYQKQKFVYTRYADDFLISSMYNFDYRGIERYIAQVLDSFDAPFSINKDKTRYGSSAGANWNLGVMLNSQNQITVGYKKKRIFQSMLVSYINDKANGRSWEIGDIQVLEGYRSYYRMVEGEVIDRIIDHIDRKFGVNVVEMIKADLRS